ncbi:membrane-spanning 4-domains subfamily A member 15-like isoform X2 [Mustelus asterias]
MSAPSGSEGTMAVTVTHLYEACPTPGSGPAANPPTAYAQKFLEGEPKALGVTKILIGLVQILFGIPLTISMSFHCVNPASPFLIGIVFILSGALSIAAEQKPQIKLLRACLATNIISSVLAVCGAITYVVDMSTVQHCVYNVSDCNRNPQFYPVPLLDSNAPDDL